MNVDDQQQEYDEEENQDQIVFLIRKLQRLVQRRDQNKKSFPTRKEYSKSRVDKSQVICYGCYTPGDYKSECPLNKKKDQVTSNLNKNPRWLLGMT